MKEEAKKREAKLKRQIEDLKKAASDTASHLKKAEAGLSDEKDQRAALANEAEKREADLNQRVESLQGDSQAAADKLK